MTRPAFSAAIFAALSCTAAAAQDEPPRWWPKQQAPAGVVQTSFDLFNVVTSPEGEEAPADLGPEHVLAQSIAGLAAQAVNEGRLDELVWIDLENASYPLWYERTVKRLGLEERGMYPPWELVERYRDQGVYDGYILYRYDYSEGGVTEGGPDADESINVATSLAGLMKGLLISEGLEHKAKAAGLKRLADVRGQSESWCFETHRDRFSRRYVLAQAPKMPNHRAIAIAHRMFTFFGMDAPTPEVYAWLAPLSSVLGWNGADEGGFVSQLSEYGHVLLPSNWCLNVTVTSAASDAYEWDKRLNSVDPQRLDWDYEGDAVSFIMSDGDNVQWFMGDFTMNRDYWASLDHGVYPIGWGAPYACLDQASPATAAYLAETQPETATLNLHAGGYYYPDLLGVKRGPEVRRNVLTRHARRLNHFMKRAGGSTLMFLTMDLDSEAAFEAYDIFAKEIEPLTGMFAIQYYPYEGGDGAVYWAQDAEGVDIPVITAKYAIWSGIRHERAGPPARVAKLINEQAAKEAPLLCWTITHTWSGFKETPEAVEWEEEARFQAPGTEAAVTPTRWCVDRLSQDVRVVTPEELAWRVRMRDRPAQTKKLLGLD